MLFCENFRWRHERGLHGMFACANGREGGDHGFARADVALQESQHGFVFFKVFEHFTRNPALRRRKFEAEVFQQRSTQLLRLGQCLSGLTRTGGLPLPHYEVVGGELVAGNRFPGRGYGLAGRIRRGPRTVRRRS